MVVGGGGVRLGALFLLVVRGREEGNSTYSDYAGGGWVHWVGSRVQMKHDINERNSTLNYHKGVKNQVYKDKHCR